VAEDYAASLEEHADTSAPDHLREGIRFEHVSFAYPGTNRRVLEDVNLEFKPGSVVAIVGENGAGKSTLVKLLARLYQPGEGRILVDGIDLARIPRSIGARESPVHSRIFFASSFAPAIQWASATFPALKKKRPLSLPSNAQALTT